MLRTRRIDTLNRGYQGSPSILVVLASIISVLGLVWLVLMLGNDPLERTRLPDDARLTRFMAIPASGPWLGINLDGPEKAIKPGGRLPPGVEVTGVILDSPAAAAGLQRGDVITRVDGTRVQLPGQLRQAVVKKKQGDSVRLVIERDGRRKVLRVRVGSAPAIQFAAATAAVAAPAEPDRAWLGVDVQPLSPLLASRLGLTDGRGIVVSYVYAGSPASTAGFAQGDVIQTVGETRVRDIDQFASLLRRRRPGDALRVGVWQAGALKTLHLSLSSPPPKEKLPPPTLPEPEVEVEAAWLGLDIVPLTRVEAQELGLPADLRGMVVDAVAPGVGMDAGFQQGDVIVAVNGVSTRTVNDFQEAAEGAVGALVDVIRYGRHLYISVPPPGEAQAVGALKPQVRRVGWQGLW